MLFLFSIVIFLFFTLHIFFCHNAQDPSPPEDDGSSDGSNSADDDDMDLDDEEDYDDSVNSNQQKVLTTAELLGEGGGDYPTAFFSPFTDNTGSFPSPSPPPLAPLFYAQRDHRSLFRDRHRPPTFEHTRYSPLFIYVILVAVNAHTANAHFIKQNGKGKAPTRGSRCSARLGGGSSDVPLGDPKVVDEEFKKIEGHHQVGVFGQRETSQCAVHLRLLLLSRNERPETRPDTSAPNPTACLSSRSSSSLAMSLEKRN